ncbi:hypothetical protein ISN45_Aa03g002510 [Arabidopsis thaliana x Arabidopsis arenosa]|uniref:Transmembrane protein n=1 Tax=Arabidopsis thaliana x Arabidopsis arenosa TaxID=1240361 RepID=A0A8T2APA3_9BRAS|nr:hypothetical protein ISN45_Aa03g002510 [Arabidopsis thaliana x Arabidopsis arenosa]KAG7575797.1 hypothetical protein ISN45_Aa03g002510 [Arabidopsis thaliana x Arabidopsis arenosa]KAG7575798.1 hypothetical protein ISN45_Aa03g002510 [Arabidopsis thaliana x Arabidopsis arenosa]
MGIIRRRRLSQHRFWIIFFCPFAQLSQIRSSRGRGGRGEEERSLSLEAWLRRRNSLILRRFFASSPQTSSLRPSEQAEVKIETNDSSAILYLHSLYINILLGDWRNLIMSPGFKIWVF